MLDVASSKAFLRTPGRGIIAAELLTGLVLLLFAAAEGIGTEAIATAGLAAVGGLAIGLGLGMIRHRMAASGATGEED